MLISVLVDIPPSPRRQIYPTLKHLCVVTMSFASAGKPYFCARWTMILESSCLATKVLDPPTSMSLHLPRGVNAYCTTNASR
jgi:hypothetical protein